MEYILIVLLFAAVIVFAGKYYGLKKQLKTIYRQLSEQEHQLVSVALIDKDIELVVLYINKLLEKIQQTIMKSNAASNALKSSIADISHDMKTPLTSVIGYLQLAEKECKDQKTEELIKICLERSQYCNSLINDFFELSLLESQGCKPNLETVDVAGLLCEQILAHHPIFEEKRIAPHFENPDQTSMVSADPTLLNRVFQNLISNGIKYTNGDIFFRILEEKDQVRIIISNPISTCVDVNHIFDRFFTQDSSRNTGNGIGLYICKQFIEAMGGTIFAEVKDGSLSIFIMLHSHR